MRCVSRRSYSVVNRYLSSHQSLEKVKPVENRALDESHFRGESDVRVLFWCFTLNYFCLVNLLSC